MYDKVVPAQKPFQLDSDYRMGPCAWSSVADRRNQWVVIGLVLGGNVSSRVDGHRGTVEGLRWKRLGNPLLENREQGRMGQSEGRSLKSAGEYCEVCVPKRKRWQKGNVGRVNGVGRLRVMDRSRWKGGGKGKGEGKKRTGGGVMNPNVVWARAG